MPPAWTTWPRCTGRWVITRKPSRFAAKPWRSASGRWARITPTPSRAEVQETPVRDGGFFRAGQVFASLLTGGSPSTVGDIKRPDRFCSFDQAIYGHLPRRNLAALATERGDHAEPERFGPMS
jgi:hypothetical protein